MRIYSLSKVLGTPITVGTIALAYYQYANSITIGLWILIPIFLLVILFISHGYIDFWYHTKYPVPLDKKIVSWLKKYSAFYQNLNPSDKEKYEYRMSLYLEGRSFMSVGSEQKDLPEDIKAIISTSAIQMNFNKKDILVGEFDRIFVYKHPFPSPKHQFLHGVETDGEDGVIIYSLEHLIPGITNPDTYYNIGMHAYVEAFTLAYPTLEYPWNLDAGWEDVETVSGLSKKVILSTIGFETVDLFIVLATCYFTYPTAFKNKLPKLNQELEKLFGEE